MDGRFADVVFSGGLIHGRYVQSGTVYPVPGGGVLASGNVQSGHVASGAIQGAAGATRHIASGTLDFFDFAPSAVDTATIAANAVKSGKIGSGAVGGYFAPTRHIQSGSVGVFDFGSGAVMAGQLGSGAVQSGNISSGSVGENHTQSGVIYGRPWVLTSGQVVSGNIASGQVGTGHLADGAVQSGDIASGNVGRMHLASGAVNSGHINTAGTPDGTKFLRDDYTWAVAGGGLTSGAVQSGHVASGTVGGVFGATRHIQSGTLGTFDFGSGAVIAGAIGSGAVQSGNIASGQLGYGHFASGVGIAMPVMLGEAMSGVKAVAWASGATSVLRASMVSGLLRPVQGIISVAPAGVGSGTITTMYMYGFAPILSGAELTMGNSTPSVSGKYNEPLAVLSGSATIQGQVSRDIPASGTVYQPVGHVVKAGLGGGTMFVRLGMVRASGTFYWL